LGRALELTLGTGLGTNWLTHIGIVVANSSYLVQMLELLTLLVDLNLAGVVYGVTVVLKEALLFEGMWIVGILRVFVKAELSGILEYWFLVESSLTCVFSTVVWDDGLIFLSCGRLRSIFGFLSVRNLSCSASNTLQLKVRWVVRITLRNLTFLGTHRWTGVITQIQIRLVHFFSSFYVAPNSAQFIEYLLSLWLINLLIFINFLELKWAE
jgi:hypothetical protein